MKEYWLSFTTLNDQVQMLIIVLVTIFIIYLIKIGIIDLIVKKYFGKKEPDKKCRPETHESCLNFPSLVSLVKEAIYTSSKIQTIKREDTIYDQINMFDNLFDDIFKILKSNYLTLFKNHNDIPIDGLLNNIQVKLYLSILKNSYKSFKILTIKFMMENHFLEKSEIEFRSYITERSEDYQQTLTEYLDGEYNSDLFDVSREKLYKSNMKCINKINVKIEEFFYKIRDVSLRNNEKIIELEKQIKDFI